MVCQLNLKRFNRKFGGNFRKVNWGLAEKGDNKKWGLPGPIYLFTEKVSLFHNDFLRPRSALSSEVDEINTSSPAR